MLVDCLRKITKGQSGQVTDQLGITLLLLGRKTAMQNTNSINLGNGTVLTEHFHIYSVVKIKS